MGNCTDEFLWLHRFDTEFFFLVLLPPVIFESGYTLNPETLFRNFDAISVFAFLGTFVSTLVVGFIMYGAGMAGLAYQYTLRWVYFINSRMGNSRLTCSFNSGMPCYSDR